MTEPTPPADDLLLAFLRHELDASQEQTLLRRLRDEPALRDELRLLQLAAGEAFADAYKDRADASFEAMLARIAGVGGAAARTPSPMQRLREWWQAHAVMMQTALATLVVVQAVALFSLWHIGEQATPRPGGYRGGGESCLVVTLRFRNDVTERQIARWMGMYGARFDDGPDTQAHYRVRLPDAAALRDFLGDPAAAQLVAEHTLPAGCGHP
jgi:hypothetical protein